jgi:hypothetical protein
MKNKTVCRREAASKNIQGHYPSVFVTNLSEVMELSDIVKLYSQLRMKAGWKIYSSKGQVYAAKNGARVCSDDLMSGIIGDESPLSYLQACVCYHHLLEYSNHKTDVISQAILDDNYITELDLFGNWNFGVFRRSLNPIFFYDSLMHPAVIFFTFHQEGMEVIQKHVHRFSYGRYKLKTLRRTWATIS